MQFPISRDPPEGGTPLHPWLQQTDCDEFPISRDPPEGGTHHILHVCVYTLCVVSNF